MHQAKQRDQYKSVDACYNYQFLQLLHNRLHFSKHGGPPLQYFY